MRIGEPVEDDLEGAVLVIAATDDEASTGSSGRAERDRYSSTSLMCLELCDFIVPARINRGPIAITISTGGSSPALSKHLRRVIEEHVTARMGGWRNFRADGVTRSLGVSTRKLQPPPPGSA